MKLPIMLLLALGTAALSIVSAKENTLYPEIADTTHATPATVHFFDAFFTAKSKAEVDTTMQYFSPDLATYTDSTVGTSFGFSALKDLFTNYMPNWGEGRSYPTRILGNLEGGNGSALVAFTNTPELFGSETRVLSAVDIRNGEIVRWLDYWDSTSLDNATYAQLRTPSDKFPTDFKDNAVGEAASKEIQSVSVQLSRAFAQGDAKAAAALFTYDAVFEDMSLRTEIQGRTGIERYLVQVLAKTPFGMGSVLRHVVGGASGQGNSGGGFEWRAAPRSGANIGITALELDENGHITRATTVYDGRLLSSKNRHSLLLAVLER